VSNTSQHRSTFRKLAFPLMAASLGLTLACPLGAAAAPDDRSTPGTGAAITTSPGTGRPGSGDSGPDAKKPAGQPVKDRYLVQLAEQPVTTYTGEVDGLPATKPLVGKRFAPQSSAANRYRKHLGSTRSAVLSRAGARAAQTYTTAFNGFSAHLTAAQLNTLKQDARVTAITQVRLIQAQPPRSAPPGAVKGDSKNSAGSSRSEPQSVSALNSIGPAGTGSSAGPDRADSADRADRADRVKAAAAAAQAADRADRAEAAKAKAVGTGKGIVVGVIDTGIWPESASFAKKMSAPASWHGTCQEGTDLVAKHCNGKIVGARYFPDGYLAYAGALPPGESASARDMDGHGTHTASTAAGRPVAHATIDGKDFGAVQGVAPDAQIAAYKVLWDGSGTDEDIMAGIDAAVSDGVQVINYSAGPTGGENAPNSMIGFAFLNAYKAGIFVSTSAGNDGFAGFLSNNVPWVTTVGAAVTKLHEATVGLGDGTEIIGGSLDRLPDTRTHALVFGDDAAADPNAASADAQVCLGGSLDAAKVRGKIVACNYYIARDAVAEVKAKGGAGVVLFQSNGGYQANSYYGFPTVHLWSRAQAATLQTYLIKSERTAKPAKASLATGGDGSSVVGLPSMAQYSSYGPDRWHLGLQKPDLLAEGTDVIAAVSPAGDHGRAFDAYSGTSMAAPKVAGMAAVLRQAHPSWSPGSVASALRTTATDTKGTAIPITQGSGMPGVAAATDPGLVLEPAIGQLNDFAIDEAPEGRNVNQPAISLNNFDGLTTQVVTRRFSNVGSRTETYKPTVSGLKGMSITFSPKTFTLKPGKSATVKISLKRGTAAWDRFSFGSIRWRSAKHSVRVTVAARPAGVLSRTMPDDTVNGTKYWEFGRVWDNGQAFPDAMVTAKIKVRTNGYVAARTTTGAVPTPYRSGVLFNPKGFNLKAHTITVPKNSAGLVVQLTSPDSGSDLDLYLYKDGKPFDFSWASWSSNEVVSAFRPPAGTYTAYVFSDVSDGDSVDYSLHTTVIGATAKGAPTSITAPATMTRGEAMNYQLTPKRPLPVGRHWAYTEIVANGQVIPANLVGAPDPAR
jgi:subtilase family protein/fibronectin type III domain protein/peptidase inhibitor I9/pre-peptidase